MNHDEIYENSWEDKEHECLLYLKNDVFSTVFCYAVMLGIQKVWKKKPFWYVKQFNLTKFST